MKWRKKIVTRTWFWSWNRLSKKSRKKMGMPEKVLRQKRRKVILFSEALLFSCWLQNSWRHVCLTALICPQGKECLRVTVQSEYGSWHAITNQGTAFFYSKSRKIKNFFSSSYRSFGLELSPYLVFFAWLDGSVTESLPIRLSLCSPQKRITH